MNAHRSSEIVVVATHARAVPAPERERFAVALREAFGTRGFVFQTCHRVEGYVVGGDDERGGVSIPIPEGGQALRGEAAIRHAIAVAVGRDSVVVGEDQVLHQLRAAVDGARISGGLDPALERLFAAALRSGRRARSWRSGPDRSLATVAVAEIERRIGALGGRRVLVVGAGRMGRLAARAAATAGAAVEIANRTPQAAATLAREVAGDVVPFDPGAHLAGVATIVVAIAGRWSISAEAIDALDNAIVADLSVPSALDPILAERLGDRLISADDLARIESGAPDENSSDVRRLDALIDGAANDVLRWIEGRERRAAASALAERADLARRVELEQLWRQLPNLDADSRAAIESMTRHLSERLLREPLERLGKDPDGRAEQALRDVFAL